jgi:iduronate 2-sulfatase
MSTKKSRVISVILAAIAAASIPSLAVARNDPLPISGSAKTKNVLLIMADDASMRMNAFGFRQVKTPNIDRLAKTGTRFIHAYSQYPWCGPSRASLLSGKRPDSIRVFDNSASFRTAFPNIVTLPQYFKNHGYFTGRIGKIFHQANPADIGKSGADDPQSWTEFRNPKGSDRNLEDKALTDFTPGLVSGVTMSVYADERTDGDHTDALVADEAIEMLARNKDRPFFIGVGFYSPHVPNIAPKRYFDIYPLHQMKPTLETAEHLARIVPANQVFVPPYLGMSVNDQKRFLQAYYASTTYMDAQVGRLLDALSELGLDQNTIVVFMSDHGFMLGEHGQWQKVMLWEESSRTPLIIRAPGNSRRGSKVGANVELLDIYPTLLDLAGLPQSDELEGKSLLSLIRRPGLDWQRPAFSQVRGGRSVRTDRWRYTEWDAGRLGRELYDHKHDPQERRNLAYDIRYQAEVAELGVLLPKGPIEAHGGLIHYDRTNKTTSRKPPEPFVPVRPQENCTNPDQTFHN